MPGGATQDGRVMVGRSNKMLSTGKTIALTRRTFVGKVVSLLFNMLSRVGMVERSDRMWSIREGNSKPVFLP